MQTFETGAKQPKNNNQVSEGSLEDRQIALITNAPEDRLVLIGPSIKTEPKQSEHLEWRRAQKKLKAGAIKLYELGDDFKSDVLNPEKYISPNTAWTTTINAAFIVGAIKSRRKIKLVVSPAYYEEMGDGFLNNGTFWELLSLKRCGCQFFIDPADKHILILTSSVTRSDYGQTIFSTFSEWKLLPYEGKILNEKNELLQQLKAATIFEMKAETKKEPLPPTPQTLYQLPSQTLGSVVSTSMPTMNQQIFSSSMPLSTVPNAQAVESLAEQTRIVLEEIEGKKSIASLKKISSPSSEKPQPSASKKATLRPKKQKPSSKVAASSPMRQSNRVTQTPQQASKVLQTTANQPNASWFNFKKILIASLLIPVAWIVKKNVQNSSLEYTPPTTDKTDVSSRLVSNTPLPSNPFSSRFESLDYPSQTERSLSNEADLLRDTKSPLYLFESTRAKPQKTSVEKQIGLLPKDTFQLIGKTGEYSDQYAKIIDNKIMVEKPEEFIQVLENHEKKVIARQKITNLNQQEKFFLQQEREMIKDRLDAMQNINRQNSGKKKKKI